jgi:hypothetical protein
LRQAPESRAVRCPAFEEHRDNEIHRYTIAPGWELPERVPAQKLNRQSGGVQCTPILSLEFVARGALETILRGKMLASG